MTDLGDRPRTDAPRTNRDQRELDRKRALLTAPRMAPLVELVSALRSAHGEDRVPDFNPTEAGVEAPILLLLEAPGPKATVARGGSGFVSPDNNDSSAENMWRLLAEAGIDRRHDVVTWNIVPWYVGDGGKIRAVTAADLAQARPYLHQLLGMLSQLRVVVLIGAKAQRGWKTSGSALETITAPHPSPTNLNTRPHYRELILDALREAKEIADEP